MAFRTRFPPPAPSPRGWRRSLRARTTGFTLLELIITLAVLGVLLGIAAPSFSDMISEARLREQHRGLASTLRLARSEAEQRGSRVVVCARASDTACGSDWNEGWIAFVDERGGTANVLDATETVLRRQEPVRSGRISIVARQRAPWATQTQATDLIVIEPRTRGATVLVVLCDSRGVEHALPVVIDPSGGTRTSLGLNTSGARLDPWSAPLVCPA